MNWRPRVDASSKPKYLALVEALEHDIARGVLHHGDRLPPQRDLADHLDITIATITKAIREATRRGIVTARTGSGTFVRVRESAHSQNRLRPDLSLNNVPTGPTKPYLDATLEELGRRRQAEILCAYEPSGGFESHRAGMATWLRRRHLFAKPSEVLLTHGGHHALACCFHALTKPDDTVLCEEWSYSGIPRLANLCHVRAVGVGMDSEGIDPAKLRQALKSTGAKLVFCSAVVQNPTTATMSLARRREILSICRKADALIVEDDIFGILSGEDSPPLAALDKDHTIHISSLSKLLSPGVRLGAVVAPDVLLPGLQNALVSLQWTAPSFWAALFEAMRLNGTADRCLTAHRKEARRRIDLFNKVMRLKATIRLPTYHVWQTVPSAWRIDDFVAELSALDVRVSPAQHFAISGDADKNFIRVCLGGADDMEALKDQLTKLSVVMHGRPRLTASII
jgi:DNA-binding transcriptional MocR family regulator